LKPFTKDFVAVSPYHITIIEVRLNKAIIIFDFNTERDLMPSSLNCTKGEKEKIGKNIIFFPLGLILLGQK